MLKIEPEEGSLIIFPSYLPHSVEPNKHDEERISISFNVLALPVGTYSPQ
jgi:ectoine hydroxylase-related dioxygenase (phytanoyl-CoA dioxygenase family)